MIELNDNRSLFRKNNHHSSPYRIVIILALLMAGLYLLRGYQSGQVEALFLPTPTPTRIARSYALEGEIQFVAGNLPAAIAAYQRAMELDPTDARLIAELARIQTYFSSLSTTDAERIARLQAARENIDRATEVAPEDSYVLAIRAFVYNWNAVYGGDKEEEYLSEAEQSVLRAIQFDSNNALAFAYYAEILIDQQKYVQADESMRQALERDPSLMDVHRVSGYVQESLADYEAAIQNYLRATQITPNFTPLYIRIGANYRTLALRRSAVVGLDHPEVRALYEEALVYYAKAVSINKQIGVKDPIPYLAIARTYSQMGEFFAASLNVRTALAMLPENPDIYGQLGLVYFRARNFESAIPAFQCAVRGCDAAISCDVRQCNPDTDAPIEIEGLELTSASLIYYYTYGSVLAGMHRPGLEYCQEAVKVLAEVRARYAEDETILAIIEPSEQICASYNITAP
ncbi:MAG: tetratricopeptide repeat protein [Bellilinea sp.]|jgi:tetratricopeptide (TPR) repeat protein